MSACTFFGHADSPATIYYDIFSAIEKLITDGVNSFYVGNNGCFDAMVLKALKELRAKYPEIKYTVVLAYMPKKTDFDNTDYDNTILPEGIEKTPKRFAISYRNKWMIDYSDYVITYLTHSWGGAAQFAEKAKKANKIVINLM